MSKRDVGFFLAVIMAMLANSGCSKVPVGPPAVSITPVSMQRIASVDERYQSFNIEMIEVTGGRFWKPYKDIEGLLKKQAAPKADGSVPAGMDPGLYQQRPPINLGNARLRALAAGLAPAYMRVSGTWANTTYFHDSDSVAPAAPPKGFSGVLTRPQWKGVVDFSKAADAKLVTSFATSPGTRDALGLWTPKEARKLLAYTKAVGGSIAAAEYMNEPTYAEMGGAPKGYDAAAYGRDIAVFRPFMKQSVPEMILLGPGGVGEGVELAPIGLAGNELKSEDLFKATGPAFDAFSYHSYGATSKRCASMGPASQTTPEAALSEDFLSRADKIEEFYAALRDKFEPGKPIWLTETADAACGGNPWASTFLDSFRYLDQLGRLAKRGVRIAMHNTLASSDYGLLDENSFAPRPNYWAALLWRKLMGAVVLDAGAASSPDLNLYAHSLRGVAGGVALLAINASNRAQFLQIARGAERYTLSAPELQSSSVQLNGTELKLGANDAMPQIGGVRVPSGIVTLAPRTITFLAFADAKNSASR
jgi:heparanase 1